MVLKYEWTMVLDLSHINVAFSSLLQVRWYNLIWWYNLIYVLRQSPCIATYNRMVVLSLNNSRCQNTSNIWQRCSKGWLHLANQRNAHCMYFGIIHNTLLGVFGCRIFHACMQNNFSSLKERNRSHVMRLSRCHRHVALLKHIRLVRLAWFRQHVWQSTYSLYCFFWN